jgi:autoaggregation protein RapA/B/C
VGTAPIFRHSPTRERDHHGIEFWAERPHLAANFHAIHPGQPDIASGYAGFKFGDKLDGNLWAVAEANGNEYVISNPYNPFFNHADGKLFTIEGVDVATNFDPGYEGVDALVTFEGYIGGNKVSEMAVTVYGDTIADGQHISLEALGAVDFVRFDIHPDVEPTGFPQLAFDNFTVLV